MASRRGPRPARDLIQSAKFRMDTATGFMRVHKKVCVKCARGTNPGRDYCDTGWEGIKEVTRTTNRYRRLVELAAAQGVQGSLW